VESIQGWWPQVDSAPLVPRASLSAESDDGAAGRSAGDRRVDEGGERDGVVLSRDEFRERVLRDQRRRKMMQKQRLIDWYGYQSELGSRMRAGAFRGRRLQAPGGRRG
jgi:uncharacterized protein YbaA (DUF1428 family)